MKLLIDNAQLLDPSTGLDAPGALALAEGRIVPLDGFTPDHTLDAQGAVLAPGLVDLHARLRAPGASLEGSIESELRAAVAGGVTTLVCPPDTDPVLDEPGLVDMLCSRCERAGLARVAPLGALTRGRYSIIFKSLFFINQAALRNGNSCLQALLLSVRVIFLLLLLLK
ncbi:MAG: hypothetical protein J0L58_10330, partial [Burkholderiales bacterium]|nr:hypothetical protein [Burkholderiales bacterium]